MGLINIPAIQNNTVATDEMFNSRFGAIVTLLNGGLDTANLADKAVTTPKLGDLAVTKEKIGAQAVTRDKLEKPHYGKLHYAVGGAGGGQVIVANTETAAGFDALDPASVGITKEGVRMRIARDGLYNITIQMMQSDGPQTGAFIVWLWLNTGAVNDIATRLRFRHFDRSLVSGIGQTYNHTMFLKAGWFVGADVYSGGQQIRIAAVGTGQLDVTEFGPYIAVSEVR